MLLPPRLSALLGAASVQEVTEAHLNALITEGVSEDQDLDFKRERYKKGPEGSGEIGKDAAAMANHVGGLIIIGMAEDDQGRARELVAQPLDDSEKGRIRQALAERVFPMIAGLEIHFVRKSADPPTGYCLIAIPRSALAPHAVRHEKPKPLFFSYPLRHGTTTHTMTETEIAVAYRNRLNLAKEQADRLTRLLKNKDRHTPPQLSLAVALAPALPGSRALSGPKPVQSFLASWQSDVINIGGEMVTGWTIYRGKIRFWNPGTEVELHTDGAGWARVVINSAHDEVTSPVRVDRMEAELTEMIALLGSYAAWCGAAGDCDISARFDADIWFPVDWLGSDNEVLVSRRRASKEPAVTTAPIGQLAGNRQQAGQAAYLIARDLAQDVGLADAVSLLPSGLTRGAGSV